MKLASFTQRGRAGFGAVQADGIVDLARRTGYPSLLAALAADALAALKQAAQGAAADYRLSEVTLTTPLPEATNYFCVGRNYKGHVAEVAGQLPAFPSMFLRRPSSAFSACRAAGWAAWRG